MGLKRNDRKLSAETNQNSPTIAANDKRRY